MNDISMPPLGEMALQPAADACLHPLLIALDWTGEPRHLCEVLPHGQVLEDFPALVAVLGRLGFRLIGLTGGVPLDEDAMPALLVRPDGDIWVILREAEPGSFIVFQGSQSKMTALGELALSGRRYHVAQVDTPKTQAESGRFGWLSSVFSRERRVIRLLFAVTLLINGLALALPLYLMAVYDHAINARSTVTLGTLAGFIVIIAGAEIALREIRARAIARLGVRTQMLLMTSVFERLMRLPATYIENASVAGQLNRLRGFEGVRDIFSGPLAAAILDLPFVLIFVTAVFALGGWLGWFVVGFIIAMGLLGAVFIPRAKLGSQLAGSTRSDTRIFRADFTRSISTIRESGADQIWIRRYRDLVGRQLSAANAAQEVSFAEQTLAQALAVITGGLIIGFGALAVLEDTLMVGALSGVMAIVWRVLSPIQTIFLNLGRVFRTADMVKQINQLMKLPQESSGASRSLLPQIRGDLAVENVGLRSGAYGLPVLRSVDLQVQVGEFVVLAGAPGPSRSAFLKLLAALYQPSFGRIRIDGSDIRQFDIRELRRCLALVSDEQAIFSGTLAQNLLLANPLASEAEINAALDEADLSEFVALLPDGIHTDLTQSLRRDLSASASQKIKLARAYLLSPSVYLLDEPTKDLDRSGQAALVKKLKQLKGKSTVIVRTSHEEIVSLADRVVHLWAGQLTAARSGAVPARASGP
jgi:ABC-type bacteriocin/lantibiotic exporter with double-glycine peptidase domain